MMFTLLDFYLHLLILQVLMKEFQLQDYKLQEKKFLKGIIAIADNQTAIYPQNSAVVGILLENYIWSFDKI